MSERVTERHFLTRLVVAVVCVYGPFVIAPFVSELASHPEQRAQWFRSLVFLPGLLVGNLAGKDGGTFLVTAAGASLLWVLLTAWLSKRTWSAAVLSLLVAAGLATLSVSAFLP